MEDLMDPNERGHASECMTSRDYMFFLESSSVCLCELECLPLRARVFDLSGLCPQG